MPRKKKTAEATVRAIRRKTRRKFAPEEKIRIVLEGLRGETSIAARSRVSATQGGLETRLLRRVLLDVALVELVLFDAQQRPLRHDQSVPVIDPKVVNASAPLDPQPLEPGESSTGIQLSEFL